MLPRVSVVIPNYNYARYLRQRLETVLNQTAQDIEVLYLDDGSTDNSAAIVAEFARDQRLRQIVSATNSGSVFHQWNRGLTEATAEYLWFAEADDYADLTFLERLTSVLDSDQRVVLAYSQSAMVDVEGHVMTRSGESLLNDLSPTRWLKDFTNDGRDEVARFLIVQNTIPNASAVVVRKSALRAVGGADETFHLNGDWVTWARVLTRGRVAFVADSLNHFRRHDATVRARAYGTPAGVSEVYRAMKAISGLVDVSEPVLALARQRAAGAWADAMAAEIAGLLTAKGRLAQVDRLKPWAEVSADAKPFDHFAWARVGASVARRLSWRALSRVSRLTPRRSE